MTTQRKIKLDSRRKKTFPLEGGVTGGLTVSGIGGKVSELRGGV